MSNTGKKFERMYIDVNKWEDVKEEAMRERLSGYYEDVDLAIATMSTEQMIRTPFSYFRVKADS